MHARRNEYIVVNIMLFFIFFYTNDNGGINSINISNFYQVEKDVRKRTNMHSNLLKPQ